MPDRKKATKVGESRRPQGAQPERRAPQREGAALQASSGGRGWFRRGVTSGEEEEGVDARESSRLWVAIPVTLLGVRKDGQAFVERTTTVNIGKQGAKILTLHDLDTGTFIWLQNVAVKKFSIAKVVRSSERINPKEVTEICVRLLDLLDPERIWRLEAVPTDWIREFVPPSAAERMEYLLAKEQVARPEILAYRAVETTVPDEALKRKAREGAGRKDAGAPSTERGAPPALQGAGPSPTVIPPQRERASEVPDAASIRGKARPESAQQVMGSLDEQAAGEAVPAPEGSHHKEATISPDEGDQDVFKVSGAAWDSITPRTEAIRNGLAELSTISEGLYHRCEGALGDFRGQLTAAFVAFEQKGAAQAADLEKNAQDLMDRVTHYNKEQAEKISHEIEKAENSVRIAGERTRLRLQAAMTEMESSQVARLEDLKTQLQEHADSVAVGLSERAKETAAMMAEVAKKTVSTTTEEARRQVARVQEVLESVGQKASERLNERLAVILKHADTACRTAEGATNNINLVAQQAVERLEATEKKRESDFAEWARLLESRLEKLLTVMEGPERRSGMLHRDIQDKPESALQEVLKRRTTERSDLQGVFNELAEPTTEKVNEQAEAATERLKEEAALVPNEETRQTHLANTAEPVESAADTGTGVHSERLAETSTEQEDQT
jgi:hypothetical protein